MRKQKEVKIAVESRPKKAKRIVKKDVLIEFILDETGSMGPYKNDVIGGYNSYIDQQRELKTKGSCALSLTKFDTRGVRNVCERTPIEFAPRLDQYNYQPGSSTNLYDAIGARLSRLLADQDLLEKTNVVIVVYTDGYENASREYNYDQVRTLIKRCEKLGWTFVYMGANQDAWDVGSKLGVTNNLNTMTFDMTQARESFATLNHATTSYRGTRGTADALVGQAYSFFDPADQQVDTDALITPVGPKEDPGKKVGALP